MQVEQEREARGALIVRFIGVLRSQNTRKRGRLGDEERRVSNEEEEDEDEDEEAILLSPLASHLNHPAECALSLCEGCLRVSLSR